MTLELVERLAGIEPIKPNRSLRGVAGHVWEQLVLPFRAHEKLLWSPSATGPVLASRQIVTLHDLAVFDVPEFFASSFVRAYQMLIPLLVRRVAHIVTVSHFSRDRIIERLRVSADRVSVIYNGVSPAFAPRSPDDIAAMRRNLGIVGRYVLLQATSDPRKNLSRALEAWTVIVDRLPPDVNLVVFGLTGRSHVFGRQRALGEIARVRHLGYVTDDVMPVLMSGAELFLFPSLYEGFGLPIIEAMRCGTPVLTSDASATREIAADAALCVDPWSAEAIGRGVVTLLESPELRASLVERGHIRSAGFDWDDAASRYAGLFDRFA